MSNIIADVRSLRLMAGPAQTMKTSIRASGGRVLGVVHPLCYQRLLESRPWVQYSFTDPDVQKKVTSENYGEFLRHLGSFLRIADRPLFVFTEKAETARTTNWLVREGIGVPAVLIETEELAPNPQIEDIGSDQWSWVVSLLRELGADKISLTGEFFIAKDSLGCVPGACKSLSEHGFQTAIDQRLTYPNMWINL